MQQFGIVQQLLGDAAVISGERASTCGSCAGKSSCSTLGSWNQRTLELTVHNGVGAKVGDEVVIEVPDQMVLKTAWRLYGVPMLLFFAVGIAAYLLSQGLTIGNPDLWAALSGLAAVASYYVSGMYGGKREAGLEAHIVRIQTHSCYEAEVEGSMKL
jgi:sigma-E factor negative regulatory protein RseC